MQASGRSGAGYANYYVDLNGERLEIQYTLGLLASPERYELRQQRAAQVHRETLIEEKLEEKQQRVRKLNGLTDAQMTTARGVSRERALSAFGRRNAVARTPRIPQGSSQLTGPGQEGSRHHNSQLASPRGLRAARPQDISPSLTTTASLINRKVAKAVSREAVVVQTARVREVLFPDRHTPSPPVSARSGSSAALPGNFLSAQAPDRPDGQAARWLCYGDADQRPPSADSDARTHFEAAPSVLVPVMLTELPERYWDVNSGDGGAGSSCTGSGPTLGSCSDSAEAGALARDAEGTKRRGFLKGPPPATPVLPSSAPCGPIPQILSESGGQQEPRGFAGRDLPASSSDFSSARSAAPVPSLSGHNVGSLASGEEGPRASPRGQGESGTCTHVDDVRGKAVVEIADAAEEAEGGAGVKAAATMAPSDQLGLSFSVQAIRDLPLLVLEDDPAASASALGRPSHPRNAASAVPKGSRGAQTPPPLVVDYSNKPRLFSSSAYATYYFRQEMSSSLSAASRAGRHRKGVEECLWRSLAGGSAAGFRSSGGPSAHNSAKGRSSPDFLDSGIWSPERAPGPRNVASASVSGESHMSGRPSAPRVPRLNLSGIAQNAAPRVISPQKGVSIDKIPRSAREFRSRTRQMMAPVSQAPFRSRDVLAAILQTNTSRNEWEGSGAAGRRPRADGGAPKGARGASEGGERQRTAESQAASRTVSRSASRSTPRSGSYRKPHASSAARGTMAGFASTRKGVLHDAPAAEIYSADVALRPGPLGSSEAAPSVTLDVPGVGSRRNSSIKE